LLGSLYRANPTYTSIEIFMKANKSSID